MIPATALRLKSSVKLLFLGEEAGISSQLFPYIHLLLRKSDLAKGPECFCRELHPIAKASKSSKQFDVWRPLSFSIFLYLSTFYPPLFHYSSSFESKRHSQHPAPTAFLCPRSVCEPVSSPEHSLMLRPMEEEQSCCLRCQDSAGT